MQKHQFGRWEHFCNADFEELVEELDSAINLPNYGLAMIVVYP